ncbi:YfbM family protein [Kitasatospora sp. NBC_00240]|uniref:YfbM family protein n=1 Tax=Kitasatospora sp. NBC_00240 TaxID=2903567 RepID=UPI0022598F15|nr:YfbM family protein [Kitasatospora sp. NBC_00240]MCX5213513.1 YfbM family protein [Kitasatospora sp. NBC_00240]
MSFTPLTPEELARATEDPAWAEEFLDAYYDHDGDEDIEPEAFDGYLDKAWAGIQFLLDAADATVELDMGGYPIDDESLSGWTVEDVRRTAERLRELPWERLAEHYDPARMAEREVYPDVWQVDPEGELEYLRVHYATLVAFFDGAARAGSAAILQFG